MSARTGVRFFLLACLRRGVKTRNVVLFQFARKGEIRQHLD